MFKSAQWYDAFRARIDYRAEAEQITELVRACQPQARTLLDVACGTGRHLSFLRDSFTVEGVDIDPTMIAVAATRLAGVPLSVGDMTDIDFGRRFDVVTCLFSSIGYVITVDRLDLAVGVMARHLNPGGVLVIEPWILPDNWRDPGSNRCEYIDEADATLAKVISTLRVGAVTILQIHYVHASAGRIHTEDETHTLGLFSREQYLAACNKSGVAAHWHHPGLRGRGLVIGTLTS